MSPSPLMSPNILSRLAVEPFAMPVFGMMPVAKPPRGTIAVPGACVFVKHAVIVGGDEPPLMVATRNDSWLSPSIVVRTTYERVRLSAQRPSTEFRATDTAPDDGAAGLQTAEIIPAVTPVPVA